MCGTVPKLIEDAQFEQCHKGPKGMKGKKGGKGSSEEEGADGAQSGKFKKGKGKKRSDDEAREDKPKSDVAGEGQMEEAAPHSGNNKRGSKKLARSKREHHGDGILD